MRQLTMHFDLGRKPGDEDAVNAADDMLAENLRLRRRLYAMTADNDNAVKMRGALEWLRSVISDWNAAGKPIQYCQYSDAINAIDAALPCPKLRRGDGGGAEQMNIEKIREHYRHTAESRRALAATIEEKRKKEQESARE